jgi:hypothetical protein
MFTLTAIELCALASGVAQECERRRGDRDETIFTGGTRQFNKSRSENKASLDITAHHSVIF